jgi:hypothetical protein
LKSHQFIIKETDVIAVETPDHPGGLNAVLKPLKQHNINVHYLYPFIAIVGKKAIIILGVDRIDEAEKILNEHWLKTYGKEIYNM